MGLAYNFRNFVHYHQGRNMVVNRCDTGDVAESYIFNHWQVRGRGEEGRGREGEEREKLDLAQAFKTSKPTASDLPPSTPPNPFKQFYSLMTKHSKSMGALLIQTITVLTSGMITCH